jgi:hypothetical protein
MKRAALILVLLLLVVDAFPQSKARQRRVKNQRQAIPTDSASSREKWQLIAVGESNIAYYYDAQSLVHLNSNSIRAWIKEMPLSEKAREEDLRILEDVFTDSEPPLDHDTFLKNFGSYSYTLTLKEFNCAKRQSKTLDIHWYSREGKSLLHFDYGNDFNDKPLKWNNAVPGTISEDVLKEVCNQ